MLEWLKRHAWKACVPQKGIASSNLALSAEESRASKSLGRGFFFLRPPFMPPRRISCAKPALFAYEMAFFRGSCAKPGLFAHEIALGPGSSRFQVFFVDENP